MRRFFRGAWEASRHPLVAASLLSLGTTLKVRERLSEAGATLGLYTSWIIQVGVGIASFVVVLFVLKWFKNRQWTMVRFADSPWFSGVVPLLRISLVRRRCSSSTLAGLLKRATPGGQYYRLLHGEELSFLNATALREDHALVVVLKLPARSYLSLPDFQDLRLLRRVIECGGRAIVVVSDVSSREHPAEEEMTSAAHATERWVRRVLGPRAKVLRLSSLCAGRATKFLRFLFDNYVPWYAGRANEWVPNSGTASAVSYLRFGLTLFGLEAATGRPDALAVVQWKERLARWSQFAPFVSRTFPKLRVDALVVGENFLDPAGVKLPTSSSEPGALFSMTSPRSYVAERLLARNGADGAWCISDAYLLDLSQRLFGRTIEPGPTAAKEPEKRARRMRSFVKEHLMQSTQMDLADTGVRNALRIRYEFFDEFCRIQRGLRVA